ncbi:hypothetical protein [Jiella marina]|uniref:hypothetical protein n=1 Tax=Jiella sp. LLJ827 TaxID=2917712 RepID=UPI002101B09D|nr:hypothetical protein [Jiella sp. LLJ827]MCQ0988845.1 hypothetical protein [Jiella sp. LLJ827]
MKKTAIFSAAMLGASMMAFGATAQVDNSDTLIPGSDEFREQQNIQERENVADDGAMTTMDAPKVDNSDTLIPGNEEGIQQAETNERQDVADDDAVATGSVENPGVDNADTLIPGSDEFREQQNTEELENN